MFTRFAISGIVNVAQHGKQLCRTLRIGQRGRINVDSIAAACREAAGSYSNVYTVTTRALENLKDEVVPI